MEGSVFIAAKEGDGGVRVVLNTSTEEAMHLVLEAAEMIAEKIEKEKEKEPDAPTSDR